MTPDPSFFHIIFFIFGFCSLIFCSNQFRFSLSAFLICHKIEVNGVCCSLFAVTNRKKWKLNVNGFQSIEIFEAWKRVALYFHMPMPIYRKISKWVVDFCEELLPESVHEEDRQLRVNGICHVKYSNNI